MLSSHSMQMRLMKTYKYILRAAYTLKRTNAGRCSIIYKLDHQHDPKTKCQIFHCHGSPKHY